MVLTFESSTRQNLSDIRSQEFENLLSESNLSYEDCVACDQTHSGNVREVSHDDRGRGLQENFGRVENTDGMLTDKHGIYLVIKTLDCVPVVLYDPENDVIANIHAGWKGTLQNITGNALQMMVRRWKIDPCELIAYLGPSIGSCCYDVAMAKDSRYENFLNMFGKKAAFETGGKRVLDIRAANEAVLKDFGVKKIEISPICTSCSSKHLPSYYRQKGEVLGKRLLTIAGMKTW